MGRQAHQKRQRRTVAGVNPFLKRAQTAEEMYRQFIRQRGERCPICQSEKLVMRIRVFVDETELVQRSPELAALIMARNPVGPYIPTTPMRWGGAGNTVHNMVRVSDKGFCADCAKDAEKYAATGPSWALVEIDRGPGAPTTTVQVPSSLVLPNGKNAGAVTP